MGFWEEFRDHQDSEPEPTETPDTLEKRVAALRGRRQKAHLRVQMAAEGLVALDQSLTIVVRKHSRLSSGLLAQSTISNSRMCVEIQALDGEEGLRFSFFAGGKSIGEQQVAELIGVAKRF